MKSGHASGHVQKQPAPAAVTSAVAWEPQREIPHHEWAVTGRRLGAIGRCSQWWIGDWIRYGTARWGERYAEAARITGYDVTSLRNMAWVASRYDDSSLRSDRLTWSHHVLLAPLEDPERAEWQERAIAERLSVADLRIELRAVRKHEGAALEAGPAQEEEAERCEEPEDVVCPRCGHRLGLATA